jgi:hypothetical protein
MPTVGRHMDAGSKFNIFFETQVKAEAGLVEDAIVTAYSDEGYNYDEPIFE